MKRSKASLLAWTLFAIVATVALFSMVDTLANRPAGDNLFNVIEDLLWSLVGVEFSFLAALIISRQPGNIIGRLMLLPATVFTLHFIFKPYLERFPTAPAEPSLPSCCWLILLT